MNTKYQSTAISLLNHNSLTPPISASLPIRTLPKIPVSAVIFDIFGTLVRTQDIVRDEIPAVILEILKIIGIGVDENREQTLYQSYKKEIAILQLEAKERAGVHAEIAIADAWERVFANASMPINRQQSDDFAFLYTLMVSRPQPMPEMDEIVKKIHERGIPVGAISNAQSFTMDIVNYFVSGELTDSPSRPVFDNGICSFSFEQKVVKPDLRLFRKVTRELADRGISPQNCLFVGNDMYRDIFPAKKAGFKTVLFTGDAESLRLRQDHKNTVGLRPDYIVNHLAQLLDIII